MLLYHSTLNSYSSPCPTCVEIIITLILIIDDIGIDCNHLKMIINRLIGLVVEILENDVEAVISLGGELLDFSQA